MTLVLEIGWAESATTVAVVDTVAHSRVGEGRASHPSATDGETDPRGWWPALVDATRDALAALSAVGLQPSEVRTIVVGAGDPPGGLIALDDHGAPVHAALTGSHEASAADAGWLLSQLDGGADAWSAATGVVPTAGSTVALLSWLHRSAPDAWAAARRFTLPAGWLVERLGGDAALGSHDAVGTAVLDRRSGVTWRTDLLAVVDRGIAWERALPGVVRAAEPVGALSAAAADELGLGAGTPLHVGGSGMDLPPTR
jgi:xylulokinase